MKYIGYLFFALFIALSAPACSKKSGCPAESAQTKVDKHGQYKTSKTTSGLLPKKKKKADEEEENVKEELMHTNQIIIPPIPKKECGKRMMLIYVDIYGNEFKEEFKLN